MSATFSWRGMRRALWRARSRFAKRCTVVVDATRLGSGGQNGGVKPFLLGLTRTASELDSHLRWVWLLSTGLRTEVRELLGPRDRAIFVTESEGRTFGDIEPSSRVQISPTFSSKDLLGLLPNLLYAPFGHSKFVPTPIPYVPLVVDLLHRELPECLPPEEVTHRQTSYQASLPAAAGIQVISRFVADCVHRHFQIPPARCLVTPICVHERLPQPSPQSPSHFLYPANFWPHKNHEGLLLGYQLHRRRNPGTFPLVLTGHRDARAGHLEQVTAALRLQPHVRFAGHLDFASFAHVWDRCAGLVFPSLHEGFGIPLVEAMHRGVPIACGNVTAMPEVVGPAALLFDPRKPVEIADAFDQLLQPEVRARLVSAGRQRLNAYDADATAALFVRFLRSIAR